MKKIVFNFKSDWIQENRQKFGNPTRQLEKYIKTKGIKLLKSSANSLTVEMENDTCTDDVDAIMDFIRNNFEISNPWNEVSISGEVSDLEDYLNSKREEEQGSTGAKTEKKEPEKTDPKPEVKSEPKKEEKAEEKPEPQQPKQEEAAGKPEEKAPEIEKEEEQEGYEKNIFIKNSPAMYNYLMELKSTIPMLLEMNVRECIWSRSLFVSIDSGNGYSSFLKEIVNLMEKFGLLDMREKKAWVKEMRIKRYPSEDQKYKDWDEALSYIKQCAEFSNASVSKRPIISLDITEWQNDLHTGMIKEKLQKMYQYSSNSMLVFRVPYMEQSVLQKLYEELSDVVSVKVLSIPTISVDCMVSYVKEALEEKNCTLQEGCDSYLEQWIFKERSDDSFYGSKTLDKIVGEIIYKKALYNCENGFVDLHITENDMKRMFEVDEKDEKPMEILNRLIGIAQVKQQIQEIIVQIKASQQMTEKGKSVDTPCIHMMFTGNPGTGKTTVARLLAKILKEEGVLRKGHFFEVQGRSLCGRYVGETAPKTSAICRDAYGSVLFIDEAYSLARNDNDRDYGKEAVQTLIAEMENHRDDFCVILAGYKEPMQELLSLNSGLKSRIPYEIEFPNYTTDELEEIFFFLMDGKFEYEDALKESVHNFFASIPKEILESEEFSNARMVRNLFERVWGKAAYRCSIYGDEKIVIKNEDFRCASEMAEFQDLIREKGSKKIGFSYE